MSWQKKINFLRSKHNQKLHIQKNMHLIYKQDFYKDKQGETYDIFIEYLVPVVYDIDHPVFIEECKQNIDAIDCEKNLNQDVKIPSIMKK